MLPHMPDRLIQITRDAALQQEISWSPDYWKQVFQKKHESLVEEVERRCDSTSISRRHLLDWSGKARTEDDLCALFLGTMIWGRPVDQGPLGGRRKIHDFLSDCRDQIIRLGNDIRDPAQSTKSVYTSAIRRGSNRIKGLGTAFLTKWLYFAGYPHRKSWDRPLILDRVVVAELRENGAEFLFDGLHPVHPDGYQMYLCLAAQWTAKMGRASEEMDAAEFGLFTPPEDSEEELPKQEGRSATRRRLLKECLEAQEGDS